MNIEPHSAYYASHPIIFGFTVLSNVFIAVAYFSIAFLLIRFIRNRRDVPFNWLFFWFSAFIFFCGTHHLIHTIGFWYPLYILEGLVDFLTAVFSVGTAIVLWRVFPSLLKIPNLSMVRKQNKKLQDEIKRRKKAEAEIRKLNISLEKHIQARTAELEEANQQLLEEQHRKDEFIGMASHELKTPITSMNGFMYVLKKHLAKHADDTANRYVAKLQEQINKQTKLITDLLDVSRLQRQKITMEKKSFDLNHLVRETTTDMQATTEKHRITIEGKIIDEVCGDSERISQVLTNLLTNAIKFSEQSDKIQIVLSQENNQAIVSVRDYGLGVAKKHIDKIFDRFYRVYDDNQKTYPGLGVGLYISSEIIKKHDGKIWVKSTEGKGSTFSFSLPIVREFEKNE